jgi:hypothetical protein
MNSDALMAAASLAAVVVVPRHGRARSESFFD